MSEESRFKKFVKKHKAVIAFVGGTTVGLAVGAVIYKSGKEVKIPEWVSTWQRHCDVNSLLYENGLPIFANNERTKIYRDAIAPGCIQNFIEDGFEIVDREGA